MIVLNRFNSGDRIAVNPDLIERIEETPDTVVTLTNGAKYVVGDSLDEIVRRTQEYHATVLAMAQRMTEDCGGSGKLKLLHGDPAGPDDLIQTQPDPMPPRP